MKKKVKKKKIKDSSGMYKIEVVCSICNKKNNINTTNPNLYTEQTLKNYVCLLCKGVNKKEKVVVTPTPKIQKKIDFYDINNIVRSK